MRYDIGKRMDNAGNTVYVLVVNGREASQHATEAELYTEVQRLMGEERLVEVTAEEARALQEGFDNLISQNSPDEAPRP